MNGEISRAPEGHNIHISGVWGASPKKTDPQSFLFLTSHPHLKGCVCVGEGMKEGNLLPCWLR